MQYYSQYKQDFIIDLVLNKKQNGTFLEIGAYDGINSSNTYFFEKFRAWNGICIEPNPTVVEKLKKNRSCIIVNSCISEKEDIMDFMVCTGYTEMLSGLVNSYDEKHLNRIKEENKQHGGSYAIIKVPCYTINGVLENNQIFSIDFCSIDTEGSEFAILKSINFNKFSFSTFSIEWNYGNNKEVVLFMQQKGYKVLCRIGCDIIFVQKNIYPAYLWLKNIRFLNLLVVNKLAQLKSFISSIIRKKKPKV